MARKKPAGPKKEKAPGRLKQMYRVYKMTREHDPQSVWWMALGFIAPIAVGAVVGLLTSDGTVFGFVLWILVGVMSGILAFMIILGRRAEKAAYSQIEGKPGAVGAVLKSSLPRGWTGSEMPIAVSPKTQDAVYRAVGRGGVVLIGEGPKSRTQKMLEDERRKVTRIVPGVPINLLHVGPDSDAVPLHKLARKVRRFKNTLNKAEVYAVDNRIKSLSKGGRGALPIPKGIDPMKTRVQRPR
jgi:F0F1-type ATP synthase assembly protein I